MGLGEIGAKARNGALAAATYCFGNDLRARGIKCTDRKSIEIDLEAEIYQEVTFRYYDSHSGLHNDIDYLGAKPLVGLFIGALRLTYGATKFSIGAVSSILTGVAFYTMKAVNWVARKAFKKSCKKNTLRGRLRISSEIGYRRSKAFAKDGRTHLVRGLGEVITLGFHRNIIKGLWKCGKELRGADIEKIRAVQQKNLHEAKTVYLGYIAFEAGEEMLAAMEPSSDSSPRGTVC